MSTGTTHKVVPPAEWLDIHAGHVVQLYEEDTFLLKVMARFTGAGLGAGEAVVVIATEPHRRELEAQLRSRGLDLTIARETGRYVTLDAAETLTRFMVDRYPDERRFAAVVGDVIARAAAGSARVRAFGEMVAVLWAEGMREAAIRLEELWNDLAREHSFSLLCSYPLASFSNEADAEPLQRVCGEHAWVIPAESYTALTDVDERLRTIAHLQQRARALTPEIAHRREVERALEERNEMLHALIEASPLPIVVIDPDGTVRLWNPAAERLFGWTAAEVMDGPIPIVPAEKLTECQGMREAIARGESVSQVETSRTRRDGAQVDVAISAARLVSSRGAAAAIVLLFEDLTDRKPAEEARARLAAIIECSDDAIVSKTLGGIVTSWNRGAERIFGYTAEEMIGQPIARLVPPDRADDLPKVLSAIRRGERIDHFETERLRKDGRRIQISLTVSPIMDSAGRIIGASKISRDVSERKQAEAERENLLRMAERARLDAEAAGRAKDEFLAMLGHELRNPLSTVQNAIETSRLNASRRDRALDMARRATDQLGRLVDDLLDVARITQGRISLRRERLRFADIVERAVESERRFIEERAHAITVLLPRSDVHVHADAARLEQVIGNLLVNAAKYMTAGGQIVVTVERDRGEAVLRVCDSGIGITAEMLPRVFDLFAQANQALDRAQGGLGIGLTIVKRLVELHGGRIEAHSDGLGKGAEFVVRLPALAETTAEQHIPGLREQAGARGPRARVLIVEDNPDAGESLMMLLEVLGHQVRIARDGAAGLDLARANVPDVMLVDIGLPGMDGYEVARNVRQDPRLRHVILVALTGYGREEDKNAALAAGFDYHLVKPINPEALEGLVGQVVKTGLETNQPPPMLQ